MTVVSSSEGEERASVKVPLAKKKKETRKPLIPIGDVIEISSDDDEPPAAAPPPSATQDLRRQIKKLKEVWVFICATVSYSGLDTRTYKGERKI